MYHAESEKIFKQLQANLGILNGGTIFQLGDTKIQIEGKDGLGGLIEEWFGVWAKNKKFAIYNPKDDGSSQEFPDYLVGDKSEGYLEVKTFDASASANFDLANFESYCESLASNPERLDSDYLIFSYFLDGAKLKIDNVWLKKIWQITCPSKRWPLKTQTKRDVIYNIRPAAWYSTKPQFPIFKSKEAFVDALYSTQEEYLGHSHRVAYEAKIKE